MSAKRAASATPRKPSRAEQAIARREALRQIAVRHFAQKGFEGTSLEDVAAEAGVTKGLLYHYFGSKQGLFLAVVESLDLEATIAAIPDITKGASVAEIVELLAVEGSRALLAHEHEVRLLVTAMLTGSEDAEARTRLLLGAFGARVADALAAAPDLASDANPATAAANLVAAILFRPIWGGLAPEVIGNDDYVRQLVSTTTRGLTQTSRRSR